MQAYTIFPNDWSLCTINYLQNEQSKCTQLVEKKYTDMVYEILSNRYFKLKWFPINSNLDFENKEVFVKTWTSRNFRDNWTMWFTENYLIWVWVWNKDWTYMKWVSGSTGAWQIFKEIVNELEKNNTKNKVIMYEKNAEDYLEIISPLNESIYKIDKTKPDDIQEIKLEFKTNIDYDNFKWFINWNEYKKDFLSISEWNKDIELKLYIDWKIISSQKSNINILK